MAKAPTRAAEAPRSHTPTPGLHGWITHTNLASRDPEATKAWCAKQFGWTFMPPMATPEGMYHLFAYSDKGGGGIGATRKGEAPGSTPTVHVADCRKAFEQAVRDGAKPLMPPTKVMEGVTIATVEAPGGVAIGLSGP